MRPHVEPSARGGDVGAEAVVAGLRVVERQTFDGLRDELDPPRLRAGRRVQLVEEAVVRLEVERVTGDARPGAQSAARAERPALLARASVHGVELSVLSAGEHEAAGDHWPRPERRSRVEGPGGRGERATRLPARGHIDLLGAPQDHRQLVDGREPFGHDAGERLRGRVVGERERAELHLAALHLRRDAAERGAHEVRGRHRRLQQHLAVGAGLELERERRRLAVVRDRSGPGARELGGKRARRRLGRRLQERQEKRDAESGEHGASSPRPRPRPPRRSARRCGGPRRSAASRRASRARAPAAVRARDRPAGWPPRRAAVRP